MTLGGKILIVFLVLMVAGVTLGVVVVSQRPEPTPSPSPTAADVSPSPTATPRTTAAVCTNEAVGYSVEYPADWHTAEVQGEPCRVFHPEPFEVPEAGELTTALMIIPDEATFDEMVDGTFQANFARTVLREETTVAGRRAIVFETEATGEGLFEAGTRFYGYVIDHDGFGFLIQATALPGEPEAFEAYQEAADQAASTLTFL